MKVWILLVVCGFAMACQIEISELEALDLIDTPALEGVVCFQQEDGVLGTARHDGFTRSYNLKHGCKNDLPGFANSNRLLTYYCDSAQLRFNEEICVSGCTKNQCLESPGVCEDSDGGRNFFEKGEVQINDSFGNIEILEDTCYPGSRVGELSCASENKVKFEEYLCRFGCVQGRCLARNFSSEITELELPKVVGINIVPKVVAAGKEILIHVSTSGLSVDTLQVKVAGKSFKLYNDGFHQDAAANDHIFANQITLPPGNWSFEISNGLVLGDGVIQVIEPSGNDCIPLHQNGGRINLVTTAVGFSDELAVVNDVLDFEGVGSGIFSMEPFKSNKDLFNLWYVTGPTSLSALEAGYERVTACDFNQQFNLILVNELEGNGEQGAGRFQYAHAVYQGSPTLAIHEFVHSFAGLVDEYQQDSIGKSPHIGQCYFSPLVVCTHDGSYKCQETEQSYEDCVRNSPWSLKIGDGCGNDGVVDCSPLDRGHRLEVNCYLGCGRQKNLYRSTFSSGMRVVTTPLKLGLVNEELVCRSIKSLSGRAGGVCA